MAIIEAYYVYGRVSWHLVLIQPPGQIATALVNWASSKDNEGPLPHHVEIVSRDNRNRLDVAQRQAMMIKNEFCGDADVIDGHTVVDIIEVVPNNLSDKLFILWRAFINEIPNVQLLEEVAVPFLRLATKYVELP